jgi:hypothetical protein
MMKTLSWLEALVLLFAGLRLLFGLIDLLAVTWVI